MGLKKEELKLGDHTFVVTQWNATKAMVMKLKIGKYFGKGLEVLTTGEGKSFRQLFMAALPVILENNDPEEFVDFIKVVLSGILVDGKQMNDLLFDMTFTDNIAHVYEVLWFVIKVNYSDFFEYVLTSLTEK